jgi:formate hydrogenlyase subunit 3/multisubunit Na+/H+ antiporter MnhD subunit
MIPKDRLLTLWTLMCVFHLRMSLTWALTIFETALIALVPLFIGFAIDGLLAQQTSALFQLAGVMAALIVVSVIRRIYDTRIFGTVRV